MQRSLKYLITSAKSTCFYGILAMLILLFGYTAASKFMDYRTFRNELSQSEIGRYFPASVYWVVPATEIAIIFLLTLRKSQVAGLLAAASFLVITATYLYLSINMGPGLPCACGGFFDHLPKGPHIALNLGFALLAGIGVTIKPINKKVHRT